MPDCETFDMALVECVRAAGGSAIVGPKLWPAKDRLAAQRHLLNCLSESKPERLSPEHVLFVMRLARERGCHVGMNFLAHELSYAEPTPIKPIDEADELRREFIESTRKLTKLAERIELLDRPTLRAAS